MANYSLVANSVFQPFSYQELAAPLDRQEAYHEKLAEEYDKLSSQADILEVMGANDRDKKSGAYSKYKAYSDFLRSEADHLYQHGLDIDSRERLTDLRRRFNTDIIPIHNAWKKRETEAATQQQALLQNPHLMFTRDADKTSLDDYLANPMGGYGVVNGAMITAQMSQMAGTLAKKIRNGEKVDIDPYTYDYIRKYGLTEDLIRDWRNNPSLSKMFEQVMKANGVTPEALANSMNAQSIIDRSTNYAEMGMWSAIGEDKTQILENFGSRLAAQEAKEKRVAAYQHALSNPQLPTDNEGLMGESVAINWGDKEAAGASLRDKMANVTIDFLKENYKSVYDKFVKAAGVDGLKKYLVDNGGNLTLKAGKKFTNELKNYLKNNANVDDNITDIWFAVGSASNRTNNPNHVTTQSSYTPIGPWGRTAPQNGTMSPWGQNAPKGVSSTWTSASSKEAPKPNWDRFNEAAHNGYFMNATHVPMDRNQLNAYLQQLFNRNTRNGKIGILDIEKQEQNPNGGRAIITYGNERTKISDLPTKSDGSVDYDKLDVYRLANGDWAVGYVDSSGNFTLKGIPARDRVWVLPQMSELQIR